MPKEEQNVRIFQALVYIFVTHKVLMQKLLVGCLLLVLGINLGRNKFDWLQKRLHPLLGYSPQSYDKAKDAELKRRNNKLKPLAEIDFNEGKMEMIMAFKWKDAANIINNEDLD